MSAVQKSTPTANANPTKRFFVNMLTRDIELGDAILDLLDNCIDGALRKNESSPPHDSGKPYDGYWAKITLNSKAFTLVDNCGGMSLELAQKYAFRFGRPDDERDDDIPTVGVYGIGMKRALFKMGSDCLIESHHGSEHFKVHIQPGWLLDDGSWTLPIQKIQSTDADDGVKIVIKKLHQSISIAFDKDQGNFGERLTELVRTHYAYIIKKGFKVIINNVEVVPVEMRTLVDLSESKQRILPYMYETEHDGVAIQLILGMYEGFASDSEIEDIERGARSKHTAGWTILCNDRVVVCNDTSRLTGWGDAGVPAYHSQFVAISGMVTFVSHDASKLPVTTTKRGIDQNSELYASVKDVMREALKVFTGFTNKWKTQTDERVAIQRAVQSLAIKDAIASVPVDDWTEVRKALKGKKFVPNLPTPSQEKRMKGLFFNDQRQKFNRLESSFSTQGKQPKRRRLVRPHLIEFCRR